MTRRFLRSSYLTSPSIKPAYPSSSTVSTSISNLAVNLQSPAESPVINIPDRFFCELDQILRSNQQRRSSNYFRYSPGCSQKRDLLPFDFYHSLSPSTITVTHSSSDNSLEPIRIRTSRHFNATHALNAHLRDDTAILY